MSLLKYYEIELSSESHLIGNYGSNEFKSKCS